MKKKLILFLLGFCIQSVALSQPFIDDIKRFRRQDSMQMPVQKQVLFIGSSSFTKWTDVADYFPGYKILNRGFGGSSLTHLSAYINDIVFPYKPRQVVIYCGENDLAADDPATAIMVTERFKKLFSEIREKYSRIPVVYLSMKPSPRLWHLKDKITAANQGIKAFLATQKRTAFVDVYSLMLTDDGRPKPELFLKDSLHMNARGYKIWQAALQPYLKK